MEERNFTVERSQAYYKFELIRAVKEYKAGAQVSYNVPKEIFDELRRESIIISSGSNEQGQDYSLNPNYKLVLSNRVISLIGQKYKTIDNKFFIRHATSNNKPQLIKSAYKKMNSEKYNWFVELYDKNCIGSTISFRINEITKEFIVDVSFNYEVKKIEEESVNPSQDNDTVVLGINKIFYGTPGCGKSYKVMSEWKDELHVRTTFYPDYTNSDFVGQIMPSLDDAGKPTYKYIEGPFTKALIEAFNNPSKPVALIIEELNRGNAAAIFGEIFQLLDRDDTGKSRYSIYNPNIIKELNKNVINKPDEEDFKNVFIPNNLSIIATMNTSDQNVYPIDTAFQRRWKFEKIKNTFLKDGIEATQENCDKEENFVSKKAYVLSKMYIPGSNTTWMEFVTELNKAIVRQHDATFSSEDKQIGIYFLNEEELAKTTSDSTDETIKAFSEKMLKYIWEDIAKVDPESWFDGCDCLDDVFDNYKYKGLNIFKNIDFSESKEEAQYGESL